MTHALTSSLSFIDNCICHIRITTLLAYTLLRSQVYLHDHKPTPVVPPPLFLSRPPMSYLKNRTTFDLPDARQRPIFTSKEHNSRQRAQQPPNRQQDTAVSVLRETQKPAPSALARSVPPPPATGTPCSTSLCIGDTAAVGAHKTRTKLLLIGDQPSTISASVSAQQCCRGRFMMDSCRTTPCIGHHVTEYHPLTTQ